MEKLQMMNRTETSRRTVVDPQQKQRRTTFKRSALAVAVGVAISGSVMAVDGTNIADAVLSSQSVQGSAVTFTPGTGTVDLNQNSSAVLNWQNLGFASGETLSFTDGSSSVVLNKIANSVSTFDGSLSTSGVDTLIFVNPNGITIGQNFSDIGAISTNLMFSTDQVTTATAADLNTAYSASKKVFGLTMDGATTNDTGILTLTGTPAAIINQSRALKLVSDTGDIVVNTASTGLTANELYISTRTGHVSGNVTLPGDGGGTAANLGSWTIGDRVK